MDAAPLHAGPAGPLTAPRADRRPRPRVASAPASCRPSRAAAGGGCGAPAPLAYSAVMKARASSGADPATLGDADLMLAYAAGDAAAFDVLYARHKGGAYRYLLRHCGNAGTADELFQDVWMNVIRARATYAPTAKFATWLYRIAHNRLVDHWRASGQAEFVSATPDDDGDDPLATIAGPRGDEPEVRATAREQGARIAAALARLPPAQRDAFLLQQEGGLDLAAIAELTGTGVETVKSRLRYALGRLRGELRELGQELRPGLRHEPRRELR